jgi:hypothetical protein
MQERSMRFTTALIFAATAVLPSTAKAEDGAGTATSTPAAAPTPDEFRLGTSFGALVSTSDKYTINSYNVLFAPEYEWEGRLVFTGLFRLTTASIGMVGPESMPFDAKLSLPWQFSLGSGVRVRLYRHKYFDVSLYGSFEFPLGENKASLDEFRYKGDKAEFVPELDTLRRHTEVRHVWRRLEAGATLRGHFGRWRPYIDLGYVNAMNRLVASFDDEATELFAQAEFSPDRFYNKDQSTFFYAVGTDVDVSGGIRLRISTTLIPMSDGVFFSGELGVILPIEFPNSWK